MTSTSGLVLFAHGARDPEWAEPFRAIAARVAETRPDLAVKLAFLEFQGPALADAINELVAAGHGNIRIAPLFMAQGGHLKNDVPKLLDGIRAAKEAGLKVKINTVALNNINNDEFDHLIEWCGSEGFDLTFIETMPMGDIDGDRTQDYLPLSQVRAKLAAKWTLTDNDYRTGGPARYMTVAETGGRVGFITPLTHNFCESCNRVRLTCTGTLYMCLGQDDSADFRRVLRAGATDEELDAAIVAAIARKPKGHDFIIDRRHDRPAVARHMSVTGG